MLKRRLIGMHDDVVLFTLCDCDCDCDCGCKRNPGANDKELGKEIRDTSTRGSGWQSQYQRAVV